MSEDTNVRQAVAAIRRAGLVRELVASLLQELSPPGETETSAARYAIRGEVWARNHEGVSENMVEVAPEVMTLVFRLAGVPEVEVTVDLDRSELSLRLAAADEG